MSTNGSDVPDVVRERLERMVIELVGIAARPELDAALRQDLMALAADISSALED